MLLAIDVGNTNMVFGIYEDGAWRSTFRLMTDQKRTSDELGLIVTEYFERFGLDAAQVGAVLISSVVPPVMHALSNMAKKYFNVAPTVVGVDVDPGLRYDVDSEERLGADRGVACVGAIAKYGAPLIVLDFGTATTVDAINGTEGYLGGAILGGLRVTMDALIQNTSMLPSVEIAKPEKIIGTSTVGMLQAGLVGGYIGSVEYLIRRTREELGADGEDAMVVATGGLARMIADCTDEIDVVDPYLILDGLVTVYRRQQGERI